jgi:hypothetical protein
MTPLSALRQPFPSCFLAFMLVVVGFTYFDFDASAEVD